ncbi:MAG: LacI family transcriptional regulator, partial [Blastochloris sp.]|nr:LacI family transcriptional regulator [Blastochloris sp.]
MTVSRVLRGLPGASAQTRRRVQALARRRGHIPDPRITEVMRAFRRSQDPHYHETIAFIQGGPVPSFADVHAQLSKLAEARGYPVELFRLGDSAGNPRRLHRILQARGIRGLILTPDIRQSSPRYDLPWSHYAAVRAGPV